MYTDLAVCNAGQYEVNSPILVGVKNLSHPSVRVGGFDGLTTGGMPYFDLTELMTDGTLAPGELTASLTFAFHNPERVQFTYELVIMGQLNHAPAITTAPDVEALVGRSYTYNVNAADLDDDTVSFALLAGPGDATIDHVTGEVTWSPTAEDAGTHTIVLRADDGRGGYSEQRDVLAVIEPPPNRPPVFNSVPVVDAHVDAVYSYDVDAMDEDGDLLTYSLVNAPNGMAIDGGSGLIQWTPGGDQAAAHRVSVQVEDVDGATAIQSFDLLVLAAGDNRAPVFVSEPVTNFNLPGLANPAAGDVSPRNLQFELLPEQMSVQTVTFERPGYQSPPNPDPGITITPENDATALAQVLTESSSGLIITDTSMQGHLGGIGGELFAFDSEAISSGVYESGGDVFGLLGRGIVLSSGDVRDYGDGPNTSPGKTTTFGEDYGTQATFEQQQLLFPISGQPFHYDVTQIDISFDLAPNFDTIFFNVVFGSDEYAEYVGSSYIDAFGIFVNGENIAVQDGLPINVNHPSMASIPGTELDGILAPNGNPVLTFSKTLEAGSKDNTLTFIIADSGDAYLDTTAYFSSVGGPSAPTPIDIDVVVSDPEVQFANLSGPITVGPGESASFDAKFTGDGTARTFDLLFVVAGTGSVLGSIPVSIGGEYTTTVSATDADGDNVTYAFQNAPPGATIDSTSGEIRWTPDTPGEFLFSVTANDSQGGTAIQDFEVTVTLDASNTPPSIESSPPEIAMEGRDFRYIVEASDSDGDRLTYYLSQSPDRMTIDQNTGVIDWKPTFDQLGPQLAEVLVLDGRGGSARQQLELIVGEDLGMDHP